MNPHLSDNYSTPADPFEFADRAEFPFQTGDVFNDAQGNEFTLFVIKDGLAVGVYKPSNERTGYLKKYKKWQDLLHSGFQINQEFVEQAQLLQQKDYGIIAPRKLKDGTWAGVCKLMFTSAICVDYDMEQWSMYETRYCFSNNECLPSCFTAIYWLANFEHKLSLPIGNCAYRGKLGIDPIADPQTTANYYEDLETLKRIPFINDLDVHGVANLAMVNHLNNAKKPKKIVSAA